MGKWPSRKRLGSCADAARLALKLRQVKTKLSRLPARAAMLMPRKR